MDIILCHEIADFDTLGAAVGAARLYQGARIVLTGSMPNPVSEFISLHGDGYPLVEMRSLHPESIQRLILINTQLPSQLGNTAKWLEQPNVEIHVYDRHPTIHKPSFEPTLWCVEAVGSTCTLIIEQLQKKAIALTTFEATALALGLHVSTGSLTFEQTTARDAIALAWLMQQDVDLRVLCTYIVTRSDVLRYSHSVNPESAQSIKSKNKVRDRLQVQMQKLLTPRYLDILQQASQIADRLNLQLYLVGGTVRDFLLNLATDDLDLVVDGDHSLVTNGEEPWGIKLARSLQTVYPNTRLEIHHKFQTAALIWSDGLWIDIATARTEFYPFPAALPQVSASSIQQDLYRRDFTINALALHLNGSESGQILDLFGGLEDLEHRKIRVLHPNSFIEDPTRTVRAVRFAVRLDFQIDTRTKEYAQAASNLVQDYTRKGIWSFQNTRLKQELRYVLTATYWVQALYQLDQLGAWQYLHPHLTITNTLIQQLQRVGAWLFHFGRLYPEIDRDHIWQVRLELMIASYPEAVEIAERFHFNQAGLHRLANFHILSDRLLQEITADLSASQVVKLLEHLNITEVIMLAAIASANLRRVLYRYLNEWNLIKSPLGGHELKLMGYKPSKQYQIMLNALRDRVLDGEIVTLAEAKLFVTEQFPLF